MTALPTRATTGATVRASAITFRLLLLTGFAAVPVYKCQVPNSTLAGWWTRHLRFGQNPRTFAGRHLHAVISRILGFSGHGDNRGRRLKEKLEINEADARMRQKKKLKRRGYVVGNDAEDPRSRPSAIRPWQ